MGDHKCDCALLLAHCISTEEAVSGLTFIIDLDDIGLPITRRQHFSEMLAVNLSRKDFSTLSEMFISAYYVNHFSVTKYIHT
jgi:hypothetical protein